MRSLIVRAVPALLVAVVASGTACSKHKVYGRPTPQDTVPAEKPPPAAKPTTADPQYVPK